MISSFLFQPGGDALVVLHDDTSGDSYITIPVEAVAAFLESTGDGTTTYREDLTALAIMHKQ